MFLLFCPYSQQGSKTFKIKKKQKHKGSAKWLEYLSLITETVFIIIIIILILIFLGN